MRIALLSDMHGNSIALEAVLKDIHAQSEVDKYLILGDIVAIGHDPIGVLQRLVELPEAHFIRGNTDRYVVTGDRPGPTASEVESDLSLLSRYTEVESCFAWTQGAVAVMGWLDWLASLPMEARIKLPDGTRLLGVHASPGRDDGKGIRPGLSDSELKSMLAGSDADLICVGHTHWPIDIGVDGMRVVNLGCVSNPLPPDLRASYAILEADENGYRLQHQQVDYDHEAVIADLKNIRHPATDFIASHMLGHRQPPWI